MNEALVLTLFRPASRRAHRNVAAWCGGTRPSLREKADLAGERLWIVRDRVTDLAGHRSNADDPQGQSDQTIDFLLTD
jgi:hypothetical protein